jgi:hypothetical protein
MKRLFHRHKPVEAIVTVGNTYHTCKCGARRTIKRDPGYPKIAYGWPEPSKGWVK